mgnify:CR=1 FL=1
MARFKPRQFGVGGYGYCKPKPSHSTKSIYKQSDNELKDQKKYGNLLPQNVPAQPVHKANKLSYKFNCSVALIRCNTMLWH